MQIEKIIEELNEKIDYETPESFKEFYSVENQPTMILFSMNSYIDSDF